MRTTVTLDADVAAKVRATAKERNISFKDAMNDLLRAGLAPRGQAKPFEVRAKAMRLRAGIDIDRALELASDLEDRETIRKLELRK